MGDEVRKISAGLVPDPTFWRERRTLVTGHTGFKGSWLTCWLRNLGADVMGVSLPEPPTRPSLWDQLGLDDLRELRCDIATDVWTKSVQEFSPEVVFHLAAQPLVSVGWDQPSRTFETNILGTVQVMDALASLSDLLATLVVTTDKVYDPATPPPHKEADRLGGDDPYSASKAAAEIVVRAWPATTGPRATARAGNVIGGGDWASQRLLPDLVRAWTAAVPLKLRSPGGSRPWQHVLEPLRGYLLYAESMAANQAIPEALNFGPAGAQSVSVADVVQFASQQWRHLGGAVPDPSWTVSETTSYGEREELSLDSSKAREYLGWSGVLDWREAVTSTIDWYWRASVGERPVDLIAEQLAWYSSKVGVAP